MKHVTTHKDSVYKGEMYRIVFECVYVKIAISLILFAFMLQPIAPAYANEIVDDSTPDVEVEETAPESEPEPEVEPEVAEEPVLESDAVVADEDEVETIEESDVAADDMVSSDDISADNAAVELTGATRDSTVEEDNPVSESATNAHDAIDDMDTATSTAESGGSGGGGSTEILEGDLPQDPEGDPPEKGVGGVSSTSTATSSDETGTSTEDVSKDVLEMDVVTAEEVVEVVDEVEDGAPDEENDAVSESASTTTEVVEVVRYVNQFNSDINKYQFSDTECVSVGDGSFYCSKNDSESAAVPDDAVFARSDTEGDKEVFIIIDGKTIQITDNKLEDMAPYYDPLSHSVVWHRLIDGRYEIMSYDLKTKVETALTENRVNDMEPSRSGQYVVWQRWVDDNWEIVLFDGEKETQITNSKTHDVGAHIKGGYVIWNTNDTDSERLVMVYEIETGLTSEIKDTDGGMVENPRFVLVYDTTHDNGDVITKGYDFESGEVVPLAAVPKPTPAEIPEPDATGETRALIQSKSSNNEEEIVDLDRDTATDTVKTTLKNATSTTVADLENEEIASSTIAAKIEQATTTIDMAVTEVEPLALTDFDLIVEPYFGASSTQDTISPTATSSVE